MATFKENQKRSLDAFGACVKDQLQTLLSGEIFSIEEQAPESTIAALMDQEATSDLLISLKAHGLLYTAASRIRFIKKVEELNYEFSVQLRNEYKGSTQNTELNKLERLVRAHESGIPVILPRYLCFSRVREEEKDVFNLCDLVAVETVPLVKAVFSYHGINLPYLRQKFKSRIDGAPTVNHPHNSPAYAGIRESDENSFLFLHRWMLDDFAIPYLYLDKRAKR